MVYKRTNRYFDSWHRRRIVDTMDIEHSTEDNSKVERGGLEQYEQEAVEGNFEEEKTEGGNSEVEKYKDESSEADGDACTHFMSRILKMFFMKRKVKTIWA